MELLKGSVLMEWQMLWSLALEALLPATRGLYLYLRLNERSYISVLHTPFATDPPHPTGRAVAL